MVQCPSYPLFPDITLTDTPNTLFLFIYAELYLRLGVVHFTVFCGKTNYGSFEQHL